MKKFFLIAAIGMLALNCSQIFAAPKPQPTLDKAIRIYAKVNHTLVPGKFLVYEGIKVKTQIVNKIVAGNWAAVDVAMLRIKKSDNPYVLEPDCYLLKKIGKGWVVVFFQAGIPMMSAEEAGKIDATRADLLSVGWDIDTR